VVTNGIKLAAIGYAATIAVGAMAAERAQEYPWKSVRMIVPFAPGGGADLMGRIVGPRLTEKFGHPVVVDNRPAASGILGAEIAARSAPDGHTLFISTPSYAANVSLYKKLPYDIVKDFAPITIATNSPLVVVVHPSVPAKTMQEFITYARANPNKINYGSSGTGGPPHLAGEMLKSMAKIEMAQIAYKGIGPALTAAIGNEVQLTFSNLFVATGHVKAGRLRALAVTSLKRSQVNPDWPTVVESGLPGYEAGIWFGFMAPTGTPKPVISKLHKEITAILQLPDVRQNILAQGGDVVASTPEEFATHLRAEIERLGKVIRDAGIKPE
jgi:tripartite-type tricarboxylate transporter receptor subunit TctC